MARRPRLRRRGELVDLVGLLADGCQSELGIWGCLHVLRGPGMPAFVQQPVRVGGRRFVLDAAYDEVLSHARMTADGPGCRRDVLAVHAMRRELFDVR